MGSSEIIGRVGPDSMRSNFHQTNFHMQHFDCYISQPSQRIVSRGHPIPQEGQESSNFVMFCTVRDQSQHSILSHECCYHNFKRKSQGVNQL